MFDNALKVLRVFCGLPFDILNLFFLPDGGTLFFINHDWSAIGTLNLVTGMIGPTLPVEKLGTGEIGKDEIRAIALNIPELMTILTAPFVNSTARDSVPLYFGLQIFKMDLQSQKVVEGETLAISNNNTSVVEAWDSIREWCIGLPQPTTQDLQDTISGIIAGGLAEGPCRIDPGFVVPPIGNRVRARSVCVSDDQTLALGAGGRISCRITWEDTSSTTNTGAVEGPQPLPLPVNLNIPVILVPGNCGGDPFSYNLNLSIDINGNTTISQGGGQSGTGFTNPATGAINTSASVGGGEETYVGRLTWDGTNFLFSATNRFVGQSVDCSAPVSGTASGP